MVALNCYPQPLAFQEEECAEHLSKSDVKSQCAADSNIDCSENISGNKLELRENFQPSETKERLTHLSKEICSPQTTSDDKSVPKGNRVRFYVDSNDNIIEHVREYLRPSFNVEIALYIYHFERERIRYVANCEAHHFYNNQKDNLQLLDQLVDECFLINSHSHHAGHDYYWNEKEEKYSTDGIVGNWEEFLWESSEESESSLSFSSSSSSWPELEEASDTTADCTGSLLDTAHAWASSEGRGFEGVLSESLDTSCREAVRSFLQFQSLLKNNAKSFSQEQIEQQLAQTSLRLSARARHFAWVMAQGDAMYSQHGDSNQLSILYKLRNLLFRTSTANESILDRSAR